MIEFEYDYERRQIIWFSQNDKNPNCSWFPNKFVQLLQSYFVKWDQDVGDDGEQTS